MTVRTTEVTLTFNEMVRGDLTTVVVEGPGGGAYAQGPVRVVDHEVRQATHPLPSGGYRVAWRAVSADGHPVEGEFRFTVALPPGQEPGAAPTATGGGTPPGVVGTAGRGSGGAGRWALGGLAVLALATVAVALRRRRPPVGAR